NPCQTKADPMHPGICKLGFFRTQPMLGMCNDACTAFPNDCQGTGSPAAPGNMQHGENCVQLTFRGGMGTIDNPDFAFCYDVDQAGEQYPPFIDFSADMQAT